MIARLWSSFATGFCVDVACVRISSSVLRDIEMIYVNFNARRDARSQRLLVCCTVDWRKEKKGSLVSSSAFGTVRRSIAKFPRN